jgi:hypothetical protein
VLGFAVVVALAVMVSSKTTRNEIKRFVGRTFYRPKYDYRAEWLRVTESFRSATTRETILDSLHDLLVKTFATTTIVVWALRETDQRYCQVRPAIPAMPVIDTFHPIVKRLTQEGNPLELAESVQGEVETIDPLGKQCAQLCAPAGAASTGLEQCGVECQAGY